MNCTTRIVLDEYEGVSNAWGTSVDVVATIRRPKSLTGITEDRWARLVGTAVGENVGKELEAKVRGRP